MALVVKNPATNAGDIRDAGSIPGPERSPGGGHGNPLQYACLDNPHGRRSLVSLSEKIKPPNKSVKGKKKKKTTAFQAHCTRLPVQYCCELGIKVINEKAVF